MIHIMIINITSNPFQDSESELDSAAAAANGGPDPNQQDGGDNEDDDDGGHDDERDNDHHGTAGLGLGSPPGLGSIGGVGLPRNVLGGMQPDDDDDDIGGGGGQRRKGVVDKIHKGSWIECTQWHTYITRKQYY